MKTTRKDLSNNPASPENFYEEDGVYESFAEAELSDDDIDEEMELSVEEDLINEDVIENIIQATESIVDDPYANILKDVQ